MTYTASFLETFFVEEKSYCLIAPCSLIAPSISNGIHERAGSEIGAPVLQLSAAAHFA